VFSHEKGQLDPVGKSEFVEDGRQVSLDSPFSYVDLISDIFVAVTTGDKAGNLTLPWRQALERAIAIQVGRRIFLLRFRESLFRKVSDKITPQPDLAYLDNIYGFFEKEGLHIRIAVPCSACPQS